MDRIPKIDLSIRCALDMGAVRIGHGIAMRGHEDLQKICREHGIGIEMCPLSNLQTGEYLLHIVSEEVLTALSMASGAM